MSNNDLLHFFKTVLRLAPCSLFYHHTFATHIFNLFGIMGGRRSIGKDVIKIKKNYHFKMKNILKIRIGERYSVNDGNDKFVRIYFFYRNFSFRIIRNQEINF